VKTNDCKESYNLPVSKPEKAGYTIRALVGLEMSAAVLFFKQNVTAFNIKEIL